MDVLMSDVSGCPSLQKEALVSSIVFESHQPSSETSSLVSSIVAEETVARKKSARFQVRFPKEDFKGKDGVGNKVIAQARPSQAPL